MKAFAITTASGTRRWHAESEERARESYAEDYPVGDFPDEVIVKVVDITAFEEETEFLHRQMTTLGAAITAVGNILVRDDGQSLDMNELVTAFALVDSRFAAAFRTIDEVFGCTEH